MSVQRLLRMTACVLVGCGVPLFIPFAVRGADDAVIAAVASRASSDYVRMRLADGAFHPETYVFGRGGFWSGALRDESIDDMSFMDVARIIAGPLSHKNYLPAKDPKTTKLLIMAYWGSTTRSEFFGMRSWGGSVRGAAMVQMLNRLRSRADFQTANLLGYNSWWEETCVDPVVGAPINPIRDHRNQDMVDEVEDPRYFVVLMAYDFPLLWQQKKHKLLWETRFSIRQRHNDFDKQLAAMAQDASRYFGQDSHGLIHERLPTPRITLGEPKVLDYEPETKK